MIELFQGASFEIPNLGTLKPLSLVHVATLQNAIKKHMADMATNGLPSEQLASAHSAVAVHVMGLDFLEQAKCVINSPALTAQAVSMMLGQTWAPMQAAAKIPMQHLPEVQRAILASYGIVVGSSSEGEKGSDPTPTTTSNASSESSPPSTAGVQAA